DDSLAKRTRIRAGNQPSIEIEDSNPFDVSLGDIHCRQFTNLLATWFRCAGLLLTTGWTPARNSIHFRIAAKTMAGAPRVSRRGLSRNAIHSTRRRTRLRHNGLTHRSSLFERRNPRYFAGPCRGWPRPQRPGPQRH